MTAGVLAVVFGVGIGAAQQPAQLQTAHRPPAVPLVANDPYFSIWSMSDKLTDTPTKHWSEAPQPMTGLIRIDGQAYRWMGTAQLRRSEPVAAMPQTGLEVTPLHSRYRFAAAGVELKVTFFTPSFPQDLDVLSRPATYLTWSVAATDGKPHRVELLLDVSPLVAVNDRGQPVTWGRVRAGNLQVLRVGSRDQDALHLFPAAVAEREWAFYALRMQPNGLPLDNRKTFSKLDWEIWTSALAPDVKQSADLTHRLVVWLDSTPSRVPATDWYDTVSGRQMGFQARSVVGGIFLRALLAKDVAAHWRVAPGYVF